MGDIQVTQVRSLIGSTRRQRATVESLGLRRIRHSIAVPDRPEIRGMIASVAHLLEVRYPGEDAPLDLEPGQRPKGVGNPPAGPSVADDEAQEVADERADALAEPGSVDAIGDLTAHPPTLQTTDTVHKPKPRGFGGDAADDPTGESAPAADTPPSPSDAADVDEDTS